MAFDAVDHQDVQDELPSTGDAKLGERGTGGERTSWRGDDAVMDVLRSIEVREGLIDLGSGSSADPTAHPTPTSDMRLRLASVPSAADAGAALRWCRDGGGSD